MAQERLTMKKIKEILRLKHEAGLSNRAIAGACKISNSTGGEYLRRALVGDRKRIRILVVDFQKREKAGLPNSEHFFNVWLGKIPLGISLEQYFDLLSREAFVNLCHGEFPSFWSSFYHERFTFQVWFTITN